MTRIGRMNPHNRRETILDGAIKLSIKIGYKSITRDAVAKTMGISSSLIGRYFPKMSQLKHAVMKTAISRGIVEIIAQGLAINDSQALKINDDLKKKVVTHLSKIK